MWFAERGTHHEVRCRGTTYWGTTMHHTLSRLVAATTGALLIAGLGGCSSATAPPAATDTTPAEVTRLPTEDPAPGSSPTDSTPVGEGASEDPDDPDAATDAPAEPAPVPAPGTTTQVSVIFSYWGYDTNSGAAIANGYADVVDAEGKCTLTLERDGVSVAVEQTALADARTTSCGELSIQDPRLTSGTWDATLSFASPSRSGISSLVEIVVP